MRIEHDFIYHIHTFQHLNIYDFYLVQTELQLIAITSRRQILWVYSHNDVITEIKIKNELIEIYSMDNQNKTTLDLMNGHQV
jgi:hypothetical protein